MFSSRLTALFVAFLAAGQLCFAQSGQTDAAPAEGETPSPGKKYHVEVIAFQYRGPDSTGGERFDRLFVEEYLPREPFDIDDYNRVNELLTHARVARLAGPLERLRSDPQFEVMLATAWVQPLLDKAEAIDVPLGAASRPGYGTGATTYGTSQDPGSAAQPEEPREPAPFREPSASRISGSLRVYGDYLLFVNLNLKATVERRQSAEPQRRETSGLTTIIGSSRSAEDASPYQALGISERRRIKLDEVHYFDHPYIGAIVSVTRYEGS